MYKITQVARKIIVPCEDCSKLGYVKSSCQKCNGRGVHKKTIMFWTVKKGTESIINIDHDSEGNLRYWIASDTFFYEKDRYVFFTLKDAENECKKRNIEEGVDVFLEDWALSAVEPEKIFTDDEYRILLSALSRERKVCEKVSEDCSDKKLIHIVKRIEKKIKAIQQGKMDVGHDFDLKVEYNFDLKNEIASRFESANETDIDELDFYMDLLESGITVDMVQVYIGDEPAEHMKKFCEEHGLI